MLTEDKVFKNNVTQISFISSTACLHFTGYIKFLPCNISLNRYEVSVYSNFWTYIKKKSLACTVTKSKEGADLCDNSEI